MPRQVSFSYDDRCVVTPPRETSVERTDTHYTDFDYKVINYMGKLALEDTVKTSVSRAREERSDITIHDSVTLTSIEVTLSNCLLLRLPSSLITVRYLSCSPVT